MITEIACIADITTLREQTEHKGYIYRGQEEYSWELVTAIQRPENKLFLENEMKVYIEFRETILEKLSLHEQIHPQAAGQWLALMQHYCLPTRFLDWTENFNAGLYFACCKNQNIDGALYVLNPHPLYQAALEFMKSIPSPISAPEPPPFFKFPEARFTNFQRRQDPTRVVPIKPFVTNERQQIQNGVFTVSNNMAVPQNKIIQTSVPDSANNFVKVRIKQAAKSDILKFIKSNNGIDHDYLMSPIAELAGQIKTRYL